MVLGLLTSSILTVRLFIHPPNFDGSSFGCWYGWRYFRDIERDVSKGFGNIEMMDKETIQGFLPRY